MLTLCINGRSTLNEEKRTLLKPSKRVCCGRYTKLSLLILFFLAVISGILIVRFQPFQPSILLTISPTDEPTLEPTANPTEPTLPPTFNPTMSPTKNPTSAPSAPTLSPTMSPTMSPTKIPTSAPTLSPTRSPTTSPTKSPTSSPTLSPTMSPTMSPTKNPTSSPTFSPTSSLPIPGELTNITTNISITVNEKVSYLYTDTVLKCQMNVNDNGDLLQTSYIIITAPFYDNNVQDKTYLIATSEIYQSLPLECQRFLALKIMDSERIQVNNELFQKVYVTEAVLTEYLSTMDVDISNLTLYEQRVSPIIVNPANTVNGKVVHSTIVAANCSNLECGGIYGDGFDRDGKLNAKSKLAETTRRGLRKFGVGLSINPNVKVISAAKYGVSINFSLEAGVDFYAGIYAIFKCKFRISSGFQYFKFVIGAESELKAYMNLNINGALSLDLKILGRTKPFFFWLGPIPVFVRFYGELYAGYNSANIPIKLSLEAGYNRVFYEWGFEYRKGSGWREIENFSKFQLTKTFGGTVGDNNCFLVNIEPWIALRIGMIFYEVVDIYARLPVTAKTQLRLPGTCDSSLSECDHPVTQLRFGIDIAFETFIGLEVNPIFFSAYQLEVRLLHLPIWSGQHCVNFQIPFLDDSCCQLQPGTPSPTQMIRDGAGGISDSNVFVILIPICGIAIGICCFGIFCSKKER